MNKKLKSSYLILSRFLTILSIMLMTFSSVSYAVLTNPEIWTTDEFGTLKDDFEPGDIVYIQGQGFSAATPLTQINITRPTLPDPTVDSCPVKKSADFPARTAAIPPIKNTNKMYGRYNFNDKHAKGEPL